LLADLGRLGSQLADRVLDSGFIAGIGDTRAGVHATVLPGYQDIDSTMQGNICRCGTYQRIRQAIKMAAGVRA